MLIGSEITTLNRMAMVTDTGFDRGRFRIYTGNRVG
jgi:hypothetical protein